MSTNKKGLFVLNDGTNVMFTFILISSLFLLWGLCNGMIDVMDKHFQEELNLSKSQSAWVQFAHYLGYFLMSMPAGWLAAKLGYKGGIITGLLIVAVGGFWFIPATHINAMVRDGSVSPATAFAAFLVGVCAIASGLTFLETIANPYTTVLGPKQFAAARINLAQSCNGIGWIFGPIIGSVYFYSKDAAGQSTGSQTLYIPYMAVAIIVVVLAAIFYFANVPDVKSEDEYHVEENDAAGEVDVPGERHIPRGLVYLLLLLNSTVLIFACGMILWLALQTVGLEENTLNTIMWAGGALSFAAAALLLIPKTRNISHHSIWSHPHFSGATITQFFYVAAQAGIFSFFINYMTAEVPPIPNAWAAGWMHDWFEIGKDGLMHISDKGASTLASVGFFCFLAGRFSGAAILRKYSAHKVLGTYGLVNVVACFVVFLKLGWVSVAGVFLSYFFMSVMFPTIFALGIHGLGARAKGAAAYIVMAIMGGAILPKLMGFVADKYDMSRGFIVPMVCFAFVAIYGFNWPKFSKAETLGRVTVSAGH
jgi:FHS family L-fucose permease-like MFS transporter